MFDKFVKSIKMVIIADENDIIGGYDVVEYEDGEIKYFDDFGEEIVPSEIEANYENG